jgi:NAD(P)-dependent dehydrogenase (short-subunit alcohol dehydrogenase family)
MQSPRPVCTPRNEAFGAAAVAQIAALAPAGRVALPEEIAAAVTYLASEDAAYVHGIIL